MRIAILFIFVFYLAGCTFTQSDYDLQEKYIQQQREIQEHRQKDSVSVKW